MFFTHKNNNNKKEIFKYVGLYYQIELSQVNVTEDYPVKKIYKLIFFAQLIVSPSLTYCCWADVMSWICHMCYIYTQSFVFNSLKPTRELKRALCLTTKLLSCMCALFLTLPAFCGLLLRLTADCWNCCAFAVIKIIKKCYIIVQGLVNVLFLNSWIIWIGLCLWFAIYAAVKRRKKKSESC